jgi:hypothetical protein
VVDGAPLRESPSGPGQNDGNDDQLQERGDVGQALPNASVPIAIVIANRDDSNDDVWSTFLARSVRQDLPGAMTPSSF